MRPSQLDRLDTRRRCVLDVNPNPLHHTRIINEDPRFFILGLYENNPVGLAPWLFVLDRRLDATLFAAAIPSAIGALLCLTSLHYAAHKVLHLWKTERLEWQDQHSGATWEANFVDCFERYISSFLPFILGLYSFLVFTIMRRKLTRRLQTLWHHLTNPPREAQSIPLIGNANIECGDQQTARPVPSTESASYSGKRGKSVTRRMTFILQEISIFLLLLTLALSWLFFGLGVWWIVTMHTFHEPWHLHDLLTWAGGSVAMVVFSFVPPFHILSMLYSTSIASSYAEFLAS
ncbi:unnamed protein product [Cyclocybe aegerita]|uniref:Uncharacterized protein n=1 Tax=Cyclocybe aegerita TaxID=1973307 RepID=A0A8S0WJ40_CYCAE|nr:unnamed protein product [Cyclocybe aegerita]